MFKAMDNIPHKLYKGEISHPWITNFIVCHMRKRDKLYKKARSSKVKGDWTNNTNKRNMAKRIVPEANVNYVNEVVGNRLSSRQEILDLHKSKRKELVRNSNSLQSKVVLPTNQAKAKALNSQFFTRDYKVQPSDKGPSSVLPIYTLGSMESSCTSLLLN